MRGEQIMRYGIARQKVINRKGFVKSRRAATRRRRKSRPIQRLLAVAVLLGMILQGYTRGQDAGPGIQQGGGALRALMESKRRRYLQVN